MQSIKLIPVVLLYLHELNFHEATNSRILAKIKFSEFTVYSAQLIFSKQPQYCDFNL